MAKDTHKHNNFKHIRHALHGLIALSVLSPVAAFAQSSGQFQNASECRAIVDTALRLRCYDTVFANDAPTPDVKPQAIVTPPNKVVATPEEIAVEDFGSRTVDKSNDLVRPVVTRAEKRKREAAAPPKVTSLSEPVSKIDVFGYKRLRITLQNGQVWEQVGSITQRTPKLSKKRKTIAEIRKGALGSFSLQFDGKGREIKVRRVR